MAGPDGMIGWLGQRRWRMTDFVLGHSSAAELAARMEADREGAAHLILRDDSKTQVIVRLDSGRRLTIGRGDGSDLQVHWDADVSRTHAELERVGGIWTVSDDGLSRNGTFVNGERVGSRQRLRDRDVLALGHTVILFRDPSSAGLSETRIGGSTVRPPVLSEAQRRVLLALCRPYKSAGPFAAPATNSQIAAELYLSVEAVKTHLRVLFAKFRVDDLPQGHKRAKLVERAFQSGMVSERDL
jgi:pSer/pThr/pTyr-binding forkhead associated (FHA) protein